MYFKVLTKDMEAPFNKNFTYKLNKKYIIKCQESIELCKNGFHYFSNTDDIFDILGNDFFNNKYRIFEVKPGGNIIEDYNKLCCSEITLLRELTFEDLIDYDNSGKYTWYYADYNNDKKIDINKLEDLVIAKDITGYYCLEFAKNIKGVNISKLEDAVIEKDKTGNCCIFAQKIKGANINRLQNVVIEKDKTGLWCYKFAYNVKGADIKKLQNAVIKKDKDGEWCFYFAYMIKGANIQKLENAVIKKDITGEMCYKFYNFAYNIGGTNIKKLKNAILKKDKTGEYCYEFAHNIGIC
jgi:ferritin-like protein